MAGNGQGVQSQDIIKVSATSGFTPAPQARDHKVEVAKLIDVSTCIGCKACQVGCSEWNDIRSDVNAKCVGIYDNPVDLNAKAWTVMRFNEVEENDRLEWLIRKDGCMHCSEPGCLKAWLWLLYRRLSVQHSTYEPRRQPRVQMYPLCRSCFCRPRTGLRENMSNRCNSFWF